LYDVADQAKLRFELAPLLGYGHYARKNLGYLLAFERGATCIYETDDDNEPLACWQPRSRDTKAVKVATPGWINVYRYFSTEKIWPRGFPLEFINAEPPSGLALLQAPEFVESPVQQGLANGSPDVDAVWRLVFDTPVTFKDHPSVHLGKNCWCPFNSQSTWWWPAAYPLMYLPSHCSFRMTDIWRSFIAQRCLWEFNAGVVFHGAEVVQDRNPHRLLGNLEDEVAGYLQNDKIIGLLSGLSLSPGVLAVEENLLKCYESLVASGVFPAAELPLVRAWLADVARMLPAAKLNPVVVR
jgi:hypothetical protein